MLDVNAAQLPADADKCPADGKNVQASLDGTNKEISRDGSQLNIASYIEDSSSDEDDDSTVVAPSSGVCLYDNVNVVNSNDVHIGNKTIYQGPVKIKQILYANNTEVTNPHVLSEAILPISFKDQIKSEIAVSNGFAYSNAHSKSTANGVDNPGFFKDGSDTNTVNTETQNCDKKEQRSGQYGWLWKRRIILIVIVAVTLAILGTVQVYTHITGQDNTKSKYEHIEENEHESPIDYVSDSNGTINRKVRIFSRVNWLAQPPQGPIDDLEKLPVSLVIIQHSATQSCASQGQCIFQTRHIQMFHIESFGWNDIGYNFLVGGDGDAYEGRGWKKEGAHTLGYNRNSIGVCFIGTFINEPPPANQIAAFHHLMEVGVQNGFLTKDYKVLAAKQLSATLSPGEAFYKVIKTWKHWSPQP